MRTTMIRFAVAIAASAAMAQTLSAATLDLSEGGGGVINGALFQTLYEQPAGTGAIDSFVRIQDRGNEEGYNTSGRPVAFDELTDPNFTRDVTFGELQIISIDGVDYIEFLLDINEPDNVGAALINLTELQVYTSPDGSQTTSDVASLGTLRYDLDGLVNSMIILNHNLAEGSGKTDLAVFVPLSFFAGTASTDFVYLYSAFTGSGDGFEEWSALAVEDGREGPPQGPPIPVPAAFPAGLVLLGLAGLRRHRMGVGA